MKNLDKIVYELKIMNYRMTELKELGDSFEEDVRTHFLGYLKEKDSVEIQIEEVSFNPTKGYDLTVGFVQENYLVSPDELVIMLNEFNSYKQEFPWVSSIDLNAYLGK